MKSQNTVKLGFEKTQYTVDVHMNDNTICSSGYIHRKTYHSEERIKENKILGRKNLKIIKNSLCFKKSFVFFPLAVSRSWRILDFVLQSLCFH